MYWFWCPCLLASSRCVTVVVEKTNWFFGVFQEASAMILQLMKVETRRFGPTAAKFSILKQWQENSIPAVEPWKNSTPMLRLIWLRLHQEGWGISFPLNHFIHIGPNNFCSAWLQGCPPLEIQWWWKFISLQGIFLPIYVFCLWHQLTRRPGFTVFQGAERKLDKDCGKWAWDSSWGRKMGKKIQCRSAPEAGMEHPLLILQRGLFSHPDWHQELWWYRGRFSFWKLIS